MEAETGVFSWLWGGLSGPQRLPVDRTALSAIYKKTLWLKFTRSHSRRMFMEGMYSQPMFYPHSTMRCGTQSENKRELEIPRSALYQYNHESLGHGHTYLLGDAVDVHRGPAPSTALRIMLFFMITFELVPMREPATVGLMLAMEMNVREWTTFATARNSKTSRRTGGTIYTTGFPRLYCARMVLLRVVFEVTFHWKITEIHNFE